MAPTITKFLTALLGRQHKKIVILGLDEAGGHDLLKLVSSTPVQRKQYNAATWPFVRTGTSRAQRRDFDFVEVEKGGSAPYKYLLWIAEQFRDADAFIWVLDAEDRDRFEEARGELRKARRGWRLRHGDKEVCQEAVRPEAPWLVLVDFKKKPLDIAEATSQAERVVVDSRDNLDWSHRAISTTTSEGIKEAMGWLYKKLK
ncbi:hypothetical protein V492_03498 [Pseudogymnoascus sp. VKM F-4246]|nr:hypothetical protein V492_03498 [Pseudogymnoascus sp. VKM F-4246]